MRMPTALSVGRKDMSDNTGQATALVHLNNAAEKISEALHAYAKGEREE